MKKLTILTVLLLVGSAVVDSRGATNPSVEGVMLFKRHGSFTDAQADMVEYVSAATYPSVTHVFLPSGVHSRVTAVNDASFIPYPGRGGVSKETAQVMIDIAMARYPQHRKYLASVQRGWAAIGDSEAAVHAHASSLRQSWATEAIASIGRVASTGVKKVVELVSVEPPVGQVLEPGTLDLEKNLAILKEYYGLAATLNPES